MIADRHQSHNQSFHPAPRKTTDSWFSHWVGLATQRSIKWQPLYEGQKGLLPMCLLFRGFILQGVIQERVSLSVGCIHIRGYPHGCQNHYWRLLNACWWLLSCLDHQIGEGMHAAVVPNTLHVYVLHMNVTMFARTAVTHKFVDHRTQQINLHT